MIADVLGVTPARGFLRDLNGLLFNFALQCRDLCSSAKRSKIRCWNLTEFIFVLVAGLLKYLNISFM